MLGRELADNIFFFFNFVSKFEQREDNFIGCIYFDKRSKCTHLFTFP